MEDKRSQREAHVTEHLHDTITKQAPALAPSSPENHLLFTFGQILGSPSALLMAAAIFWGRFLHAQSSGDTTKATYGMLPEFGSF